MNIPKNGRIVVIDDEYEKEALPLIEALSKNGVSAMYFTGNQEKLPPEPLSGVRIVFLDIVLAGTEGQDDKTKISTIIGVVSKIIGKDNKSYLIIAWTKHDELIKRLKNNLKENPPIFILNLKKSECKDSRGNYEISKIEKKLKKELKKAGAFQLFIIWENLVHKSTGKIVNDFSSFYPLDDKWDSNMCGVFQKLARAYAGKQLEDGDTDKLIKDALFTFNGTFLDTLENEISNKKIE
jgi:rRNA processing protein Gar1